MSREVEIPLPPGYAAARHCRKPDCPAPAEWVIYERGTSAAGRCDAYTEACTAHVGEMLLIDGAPDPDGIVYFVVEPTDPGAFRKP